MTTPRHEVRTGLLVVLTLAVLVAVLVYLGAPGAFEAQRTYYIFFDNAAGIKPGAQVMVSGRKVGQVRQVFSPVPENARPEGKYESLVEVRVSAKAGIYQKVRVQMVQLTMLGDILIDFSNGEEASGLAPDKAHFIGERQPGLAEIVPQVLDKLDPAIQKVTETLDALQKTSESLNKLTSEGGDLPGALAEFRKLGLQLNELSGPSGPLRGSFEHLNELTGPDSSLAKTLRNTEKLSADLASNEDIRITLRNFRNSSEKLNRTMLDLGPRFETIGRNLEEASDTVKHQPWRLIWPSTKKYDDDRNVATTPAPRGSNAVSRRKR
jgi:hypothetical protein